MRIQTGHRLRGAVMACAAGTVFICGIACAEGIAPVVDAVADAKPIFDMRLRFEAVDQDPMAQDAEMESLRLRLGFETGKAWDTSLLAEGEFLWPLGGDFRGDPAMPNNVQYPVIPDAESYEVNRLHLTNSSLPGTTITLGRQRIGLDDQRFVGNVGWRQNEQTYDALRVVNRSVTGLNVDVSFLTQVNRFFGVDSPQGRYEGEGLLANIAYQLQPGKLTGFGYILDFDAITQFPGLTPTQAAGWNPVRQSTETYGVRFAGERSLPKFKLGYLASYARQSEYGSNPLSFDLDYYTVEFSGTVRNFVLTLGQEVLEGNGSVGFATPLATMHKFNGWADKFLGTPVNGLEDRYAGLGYQLKSMGALEALSASVFYRDYQSERSDVDLGSEINVQVQAKYRRFVGLIKYADYAASAGRTPVQYQDTSKFWVQMEYVW